MKSRYVVDTNVLIAASAADPTNPADIDATPDDPAVRQQVWLWLDNFRGSESRLVLDSDSAIFDEYQHKLGFNDFGIQVVMHKWSTAAVDSVDLLPERDTYSVISSALTAVVHDVADRKIVAAALTAEAIHGECPIAFAGDTDWHEWESSLKDHGVRLDGVDPVSWTPILWNRRCLPCESTTTPTRRNFERKWSS
jgi:hypothetical protein